MAHHSSTLAWKIPWVEEPGGLQSMGSLESDMTERLHFSLSCIGKGNGNPLQCSCLENPRDGEAWCAAVCGVAQSRTQQSDLAAATKTFISSCTVLYESSNAFKHLFSMTQKYQLFPIYGFTTQNVVFIIATKRANAQNSLLFYALIWKVHMSFCHWSKTVKGYGEMWVNI